MSGRAEEVLRDGALALGGAGLAEGEVLVLSGDGLFDTTVSLEDQIAESETVLRVHGTVHVLEVPS